MASLGLWLGLLATVCAEKYFGVPNFGSNSQRPLYSSGTLLSVGSLPWTTQMPVTDFCVSFWMYVISAHDDVVFLQMIDAGVSLNVKWPSGADATATFDGVTATATGVGNRPTNKWFHMVTGVGGGNLFIVVSLRQPSNFQFPGQNAKTFSLSGTASFTMPVVTAGSVAMEVSHT